MNILKNVKTNISKLEKSQFKAVTSFYTITNKTFFRNNLSKLSIYNSNKNSPLFTQDLKFFKFSKSTFAESKNLIKTELPSHRKIKMPNLSPTMNKVTIQLIL